MFSLADFAWLSMSTYLFLNKFHQHCFEDVLDLKQRKHVLIEELSKLQSRLDDTDLGPPSKEQRGRFDCLKTSIE